MSIIQSTSNPLYTASTTVQEILDATAQDIRQLLSSQDATSGQPILMDYLNRVQLEILRASRFEFLLSSPQRMITQRGVSEYWLGEPGLNPTGTFDSQLNLQDLRSIKPGTVYDRTNNTNLNKVGEYPLAASLEFPDASLRLGKPAEWRQSPTTPQVIGIFPAPDNQSGYQPVPYAPICTLSLNGALGTRIYYVKLTYVDSQGNESTASQPAKVFVPAGNVILVQPPLPSIGASASGILYDRYNVYASTTLGSETKQTTVPLSNTAAFTEPNSGLTTNGGVAPGSSSIATLDGYVIEFRYYKQRQQITALSPPATTILQVPDDYKDIVIQGVNALTFKYLKSNTEAQEAYALYKQGISQIVRDINLLKRGDSDFIRPDGASIGSSVTFMGLNPSNIRG